ncbi:MAG: TonB-dependent receptor, partial [Sphingobacteriales bacterium]
MRTTHFSLSLLFLAISNQIYAETPSTAATDPVNTAQAVNAQAVNAQAVNNQAANVQPSGTLNASPLSPIVVTATRSPTSIAQIAGTVQTIAQAEIVQQAATGKKVADILAQLVPSLGASSGTMSNYGQTMRGRQVQILIDGVPQTGSRDASRQLNSISPALIDHIEVVSGASSIYGSGATGGIINIITRRATEGEPLSFESKVGLTAGDHFSSDAVAYEVAQTAAFSHGALDGFLGASFTQRAM